MRNDRHGAIPDLAGDERAHGRTDVRRRCSIEWIDEDAAEFRELGLELPPCRRTAEIRCRAVDEDDH